MERRGKRACESCRRISLTWNVVAELSRNAEVGNLPLLPGIPEKRTLLEPEDDSVEVECGELVSLYLPEHEEALGPNPGA